VVLLLHPLGSLVGYQAQQQQRASWTAQSGGQQQQMSAMLMTSQSLRPTAQASEIRALTHGLPVALPSNRAGAVD
jgi:homogentisate 1,2-dioxygenase